MVSWLADYIDLVGEEQFHNDPIPLQEIWEHYSVSELSFSILYLILQLIFIFNLLTRVERSSVVICNI